jgi:cell division protein FtsQ
VARQPALALARPRVALSLRGPWRRGATVVAGCVAALGLLYLGARETPVFSLRTVEVHGASGAVRTAVLRDVDELRGESLVALDGGELVRRLEALPSVQAASYDRAFPHTLRLVVRPEQPVAVLDQGPDEWIVSVRGRVIGRASDEAVRALPRVRYPEEPVPTPGGYVSDAGIRKVVTALAQTPRHTVLPIHAGRLDGGELTFVLEGEGGTRPLLRLGEPSDVAVKLRVAALVLRKLSADELASLAYIDVSLPDRPVAGTNSQVSG